MNNVEPVKQLKEVSFDASPPLHVPFIVGNECFVLTQQDTRRIEDIRLFFYSKLGPNGQLLPIENIDKPKLPSDQLLAYLAQQQQQFLQQKQQSQVQKLEEAILLHRQNTLPQNLQLGVVSQDVMATPNCDVIMANAQSRLTPTIEQQLNWNKGETSTMFPFHQTVGTNTNTTLVSNENEKNLRSALKPTCNFSVNTTDSLCNLEKNSKTARFFSDLGARDEMKRRKITRFSNDC